MEPGRGEPPTQLIARDDELARLRSLVLGETSERGIVISGPPGVGKTVLWESAVAIATEHEVRVLTARPAEAETSLPFAMLSDLFEGVDSDVLSRLPSPQRRAIDVALLRAEPTGDASDPRAIGLAVLNLLRILVADKPTLVAVDDAQWADSASIDALAFALRRFSDGELGVMIARRPGRKTPIESALGREAMTEILVAGLSLGALRRLLATRLGLTLSRRVLRQLHEVTLGNPLFALEIGRALVETDLPAIGEELPLPESLDALLGARATAAPEASRALLAVALGGGLAVEQVELLAGEKGVDDALEAQLLVEEHGRLRPSHPLLAAAVMKRTPARERRQLHRMLANLTTDAVRTAHHLALAADGPDAALAEVVSVGAAQAAAIGATEQAIELAEYALRLTPSGDAGRDERVLTLGEYLIRADEGRRLKELLAAEFATLAPGSARARGHLLLARVPESQQDYDQHLAHAVAESHGAAAIRAEALAWQSLDASVSWIERLDEAEAKAHEALSLADGGASRAMAVHAIAWVRILRGQPIADLRTLIGDERDESDISLSLERVEGIRLAFRGLVNQARSVFQREIERAKAIGQDDSRRAYDTQLCEVELRAGDCAATFRLLDEMESGEDSVRIGMRSPVARLRAVAAAIKGDTEASERWAARAVTLIYGQRWDLLEVQRARGIAALAAHEPARAVEALLPVWRHTETESVDDPGAFPVAPDLVEAALASGDRQLAEAVITRLTELAERQEHPWGRASVKRCQGLAALADGGDDGMVRTQLVAAAEQYEALGCRFDAARTLLAAGRHARRIRKWAEARELLGRAVAIFDELGSDGWAAEGRAVLGGVGGRKPRDGATLTPTERRVTELASQGMSNKEIAAVLFVSEHTVEVHLSHAYPKLGVRSRAELSRALSRASS